MPWRVTSEPSTKEKVIGGLSYFTFGVAGLLYIILDKAANQSQQFKFHFYQSVLLWILSLLVGMGAAPLLEMLIWGITMISPTAAAYVSSGVGIAAFVLTNAFRLLLLYGAIMAFLGKFAEVPFISNIVRHNMRY